MSIRFGGNFSLIFSHIQDCISIPQHIYALGIYLLVGKEVDDGVIDWTGLGKVHGHGGNQRRNVQLWIYNYHH